MIRRLAAMARRRHGEDEHEDRERSGCGARARCLLLCSVEFGLTERLWQLAVGKQLEGAIDARRARMRSPQRARLSRRRGHRCFVFVNVDSAAATARPCCLFVNDRYGAARSCVVFVNAVAFPPARVTLARPLVAAAACRPCIAGVLVRRPSSSDAGRDAPTHAALHRQPRPPREPTSDDRRPPSNGARLRATAAHSARPGGGAYVAWRTGVTRCWWRSATFARRRGGCCCATRWRCSCCSPRSGWRSRSRCCWGRSSRAARARRCRSARCRSWPSTT